MKLLSLCLILLCSLTHAADRPNILWITSEDNSPYLGCYGDKLAVTPNLDKLAAEGLRYRHAYANAPVCSAARTTLITGMYGPTLGVHNHRSSVAIPAAFKLYPQYLREAGYYCSNSSKTDYNVAGSGAMKIWNESSKNAHYKNRAKGQPFFAVFNFTTSHESQVEPKKGKRQFRIPPGQMPLPPYHPDTPEIRRDWANYYDQITLMDKQVGAVLAELDKAGLAEDTIVFYYGDHGGALPRGKRNIHDSGTRVPFIVRFPKKWQHLAPATPGSWVEDLVSFVDFPATVFSLCQIPVPAQFQGRPFLGEKKAAARGHVYLYRGRMDERYDSVRAVRDAECRYVRNYSPHRPWGQHYAYPFQVQPSMRSWYAEYKAGRCNEIQAVYWQPKPGEELYLPDGDPFEIKNLAKAPEHQARLEKMRQTLREEILATRDTVFIPEGMYDQLAAGKTVYDFAQSAAYPLERLLDIADAATERDATHLPTFTAALADPDPLVRYWAATGCLILQEKAADAKGALIKCLQDESMDVRVVAAEAVAYLGESEVALAVVAEAVKNGNAHESLAALNTLDFMWKAGNITLVQAQKAVKKLNMKEPNNRIPEYLLSEE
jgi:N-sulfoglucosamine sulfohydrolase